MASVVDQDPYVEYAANGATTVFPYTFQILHRDHLVVMVNGEPVSSGFTVSNVGTQTGGNVTFTVAPANGATVLLQRDVPLERSTEYATSGALAAATLNRDFNLLWMALQERLAALGGTLRLPYPEQSSELAAAASRADRALTFDADGVAGMSPYTVTQVQSAIAAAYLGGAATALDAVAFIQAGTGATSRTAQAKMREGVSVKDFGATGDGSTDDTAAIQLALNSGAKRVFVPSGTYVVGAITVPSNIEVFGEGPASILKLKTAGNVAVLKNAGLLTGNSRINLHDFKIDGNKANQSGGSFVYGIDMQLVDDLRIDNVEVVDTREVCIMLRGGSRFVISRCVTTGAEGATYPGIYVGLQTSGTKATDGQVVNCYSASNGQDGILVEYAENVQVIGCVGKSNGQSGVKLGSPTRCSVVGCYAEGNRTGFRGQGVTKCSYVGNIAYRNLDSGFTIGLAGVTGRDILISGNQSIENGQSPLATSYGFMVEFTGAGVCEGLYITNNVAVDRQGAPTQTRGFSIGAATGTYTAIVLSGNYAKGNSSTDYFLGAAVSGYEVFKQSNVGYTGSASNFALEPLSVTRLRFWADNIPAASGSTHMDEMTAGTGGRGFLVPRDGWIRLCAAKANAAIAAGSISVIPRVNNSNINPSVTLNAANQFNIARATFPGTPVVAGDYVQCIYSSDGSLSPATLELDVTVELVC